MCGFEQQCDCNNHAATIENVLLEGLLRVDATWLLDMGAGAHMMLQHGWIQLGRPVGQSLTVRHVCTQHDLGKGLGRVKEKFRALVAKDARKGLLMGTQL